MPMRTDHAGEEHGSSGVQLRDTISTLTSHLTNLGKPAEAGDRATSYITLAGGNKGAVMKADSLEEMLQQKAGEEGLSSCAWANSNYQSVNNSIMIDGECHAEDPGVHIEIVDFLEDMDEDVDHREKKGKKDKKEDTDGDEEEEEDDDDRDHEKEGKKAKDKKKEKKKATEGEEEHDHEKDGKKGKDKKKEKKEKK